MHQDSLQKLIFFILKLTITQKMADQGRSERLCSFNHNPLRHELSYLERYEAEIHKLSLTSFSEPVYLVSKPFDLK